MSNPYANLPDTAYWRRAMQNTAPLDVDPVISVPFTISQNTKVATAGSCFAQHISRTLVRQGFHYLVAEPAPASLSGADKNMYGIFSAAFGNIYTVRQLLQLFDRAYGMFSPWDEAWSGEDGAVIDPFRPTVRERGFASLLELRADRDRHLTCVTRMFEECEIFIFTLGLTEGWVSTVDGAVFPIAPGVKGTVSDPANYRFENFSVASMITDMRSFIDRLRTVNPHVRVILTVSPVPLIATYESRHVLVSTIYSKSALRVVAEEITRDQPDIAYFPSFEIITGHHAQGRFFADDLRSVTAEGVAHVMDIFARHYLQYEAVSPAPSYLDSPGQVNEADIARHAALAEVMCDEKLYDPRLTDAK